MKKTWQRPELVVLVHTQPEQTLLLFCKNGQSGQTSPQLNGLTCLCVDSAPCANCYMLSPS